MADRDELEFRLQQLEARQASELEALVKRNESLYQKLRAEQAAEGRQQVHDILQKALDLCDTANTQKQLLQRVSLTLRHCH